MPEGGLRSHVAHARAQPSMEQTRATDRVTCQMANLTPANDQIPKAEGRLAAQWGQILYWAAVILAGLIAIVVIIDYASRLWQR